MTSVGKSELLTWLANSAGYTSISDWGVIADGVAVMRCMQKIWPITCKGLAISGFNWKAAEEREWLGNWAIIESCLKTMSVPVEVFEFPKIVQGRKKACYHFLVMMYFIEAILTGTATNIAFTYPIETSLKEFLQSEKIVKVAQTDVLKRQQRTRKPKSYSTTPSNLTMMDGDEYENVLEPLRFSTKDLVNIFSDTDLCASPGFTTPNHQHSRSHTQFQMASEKMKSVLTKNIVSTARTPQHGDEYSAMSPCKSADSPAHQKLISPAEHAAPLPMRNSVLTVKKVNPVGISIDSRRLTDSMESVVKQQSGYVESALLHSQSHSHSQFITPSHSMSEGNEGRVTAGLTQSVSTQQGPQKLKNPGKFSAIQAAAAAAVLNASRCATESSAISAVHKPLSQLVTPPKQNYAIRRLLDHNKAVVGQSPRPCAEKTVSNWAGQPAVSPGRQLIGSLGHRYGTQIRASTTAQPIRPALVQQPSSHIPSHYLNLGSPAPKKQDAADGAHYHESKLKVNYLYDSKKEVTSSISSVHSSAVHSSAHIVPMIQSDDKATSYVKKVGSMIQQLESAAASSEHSADVPTAKPPHMIGLALLSFSNSEHSEGVDAVTHPDYGCFNGPLSDDTQAISTINRPLSATSNLRSSMLSHTPSDSDNMEDNQNGSVRHLVPGSVANNDSTLISGSCRPPKAALESANLPKNLPRWPSKKVAKGISPIAHSSSSSMIIGTQQPGEEKTNSILNDTKMSLTNSDQITSMSSTASVYMTGCPSSILSSEMQTSGISLVNSNGTDAVGTAGCMASHGAITQSVQKLSAYNDGSAGSAPQERGIPSVPSIVHLLCPKSSAPSSSAISQVESLVTSGAIPQTTSSTEQLVQDGASPNAGRAKMSDLNFLQFSSVESNQVASSSTTVPENISLSLNVADASRRSNSQLQGSAARVCQPSSTSDTFLFASSTSGVGCLTGTQSLFTDLQDARESTNTLLKMSQNPNEQSHALGCSPPHSISTSLCASGGACNLDQMNQLSMHKVTSGRPQGAVSKDSEANGGVGAPAQIVMPQLRLPAQSSTDAFMHMGPADTNLSTRVFEKASTKNEVPAQKEVHLDGYDELLANVEGILRLSTEEAAKMRELYNRKLRFLDSFATKKAVILAHALHANFLKEQLTLGDSASKDYSQLREMLSSHQDTISCYMDELRVFEKSLGDDISSLSQLEEKYSELTNSKYIEALKAMNRELAAKLDLAMEEIAQLSKLSLTNTLGNIGTLTDMHAAQPEMDSPENYLAVEPLRTMTPSSIGVCRARTDNIASSMLSSRSLPVSASMTADTCVKTIAMSNQLLEKLQEANSELERYRAKSGIIDAVNHELMISAIRLSESGENLDVQKTLHQYEENLLKVNQLLSSGSTATSDEATAIILRNLGLENAVLPTVMKTMIGEHRALLQDILEKSSPATGGLTPAQLADITATLFDDAHMSRILEENGIESTEHNKLLYMRSMAIQLLCSENVLSGRLSAMQLYIQNVSRFIQRYAPEIVNSVMTNKDCQERLISAIRSDIDGIHADYKSKLLNAQTVVIQNCTENNALKAELSQYKNLINAALEQTNPVVLDIQQMKQHDAILFRLLNLYEGLLCNENVDQTKLQPYLSDILFFKSELQKLSVDYDNLARSQIDSSIRERMQQHLHIVQSELECRTGQLAETKSQLVAEKSHAEIVYQHAQSLQQRLARIEAENRTLRLFSHKNSIHADLSSLVASTPITSC